MLKFFLSQGFDIYMSLLQEMASDWTVSSDVQCNWFVCTKTKQATMVFHSFKLSPQQCWCTTTPTCFAWINAKTKFFILD